MTAMKRKLNEDDVPLEGSNTRNGSSVKLFSDLGLDDRILQALAKQNFAHPTRIQQDSIPLAIAGKDLISM